MFCIANTSCLMPTSGAGPQLFATTLQYIAAAQCLLAPNTTEESYVENFKSFDFIIIGAGTAGCVVANRLSENPKWKILFLEAGGDAPVESHIPGLGKTMLGSEYHWKFESNDNRAIDQGIINGSINLPKGKMFGGSSSLNEMFYLRGHDQDFQKWYDAGNKEWSPEEVSRCYKKAENLQSQKLLKDPIIREFYGTNGSVILNRFNSTKRDVTNGVMKSWHEVGFSYVPDLNAAGLIGSGIVTVTAADGVRQSVDKGYLMSIKNRKNIKILKHALVTKILIANDTKAAFGVEVDMNGKNLTFYSNHEVIVSAGAINTPKLLMLSGVGPRYHLRAYNVTCIHHSMAVGNNLQDHFAVPIIIYGSETEGPSEIEHHRDVLNYIFDRTGYLAEDSVYTDISAFYKVTNKTLQPECQLYLSVFPKNSSGLKEDLTLRYRYKKSIIDDIVEFNRKYTLYFFTFSLLHQNSRGTVRLNSNDPKDNPRITPNYLRDSNDLRTTIKGIKMATKMVKSKYFKSIEGFLGKMNLTACKNFDLDSDRYWECVAKNTVTSMSHLVGTCRMGTNPRLSAVSSRLNVHGISHLRVVDASIMPLITSGNLNAANVMIAERAAEFIKEDYKDVM